MGGDFLRCEIHPFQLPHTLLGGADATDGAAGAAGVAGVAFRSFPDLELDACRMGLRLMTLDSEVDLRF